MRSELMGSKLITIYIVMEGKWEFQWSHLGCISLRTCLSVEIIGNSQCSFLISKRQKSRKNSVGRARWESLDFKGALLYNQIWQRFIRNRDIQAVGWIDSGPGAFYQK